METITNPSAAHQTTDVLDVLQLSDDTVNTKTFEEAQSYYNARFHNYDTQSEILGFLPPREAARSCMKHCSNEKTTSTTILDLCGGTGNVSLHLRKEEMFEGNIDILDANMGMLLEASKKNLNFRSLICHRIDGKLPLATESYDIVVAVACFFASHLSPKALSPILEVLKPGGHFVFNVKNRNFTSYDDQLRDEINRLVDDGRMKKVEERVISGYQNVEGITTKLFVFVKL